MLLSIIGLIAPTIGLIVYYDASKNRIGKIPGEKGFTNASAGMWSLSCWILWFIVFPLYLLNRNQLLEKAKQHPQEPSRLRNLIIFLYATLLVYNFYNFSQELVSSQPSQLKVPQYSQPAPQTAPQPTEFNTADISISRNGNFFVAANKIRNYTPSQIWQRSRSISAASLTKSLYSSIGKLYRLHGQVYTVVELPPTSNLSGQWAEVLMAVPNPNSPLGVTTLNFLYNGDFNQINPNTYITCAGYFIGTYESENALGGKVEAIALVGNVYRLAQ
ncbi:MAG: hypothetical protein HBSIN02_25050 [Bacteroidia bacterium]|nr:MAG: hypothetical protein HBSIN02_25050 [Bacteroidia bacterium]